MSHIALGQYNRLQVVKEVDFGMYLDGGDDGEILLPRRYVPQGCRVGQELEVFVYLDMDERLVATTLHPHATVGQFAWLRVAMGQPARRFPGLGTDERPLRAFPRAAAEDAAGPQLHGIHLHRR